MRKGQEFEDEASEGEGENWKTLKNLEDIWRRVYQKQRSDTLHTSIDLRLQKGEYYIYFPFQFSQEDLNVPRSVIRIVYSTDGRDNICYVSEALDYFYEYSKSESAVKKLFDISDEDENRRGK